MAGNYYPLTTAMYIQSSSSLSESLAESAGPRMQLTLLTDRAQGGSSLHSGDALSSAIAVYAHVI